MSLQKTSMIIFFVLLALLVLAGLLPSPLTIMLVAGASSVLVAVQAYAILRDDSGSSYPGKSDLSHYQNK